MHCYMFTMYTQKKTDKNTNNVVLLDLRKAYLQIHVAKDMWKHQTVKWNKKYYQAR